jgi:hypothetical protein
MALRKNPESRPQISDVSPPAAIPGGEFRIRGKGLTGGERPLVRFGELAAPVVIGSDSLMIVRVPEGASRGDLVLGKDEDAAWTCDIGIQIAEGLASRFESCDRPAGEYLRRPSAERRTEDGSVDLLRSTPA